MLRFAVIAKVWPYES